MMKKWKENKEWSRNTQWFSGDNDSLFTPDQCSVPEEGHEVSCPSHAAAGGTSTVKHTLEGIICWKWESEQLQLSCE